MKPADPDLYAVTRGHIPTGRPRTALSVGLRDGDIECLNKSGDGGFHIGVLTQRLRQLPEIQADIAIVGRRIKLQAAHMCRTAFILRFTVIHGGKKLDLNTHFMVEMACANDAAASTFISAALATMRPKSAISRASRVLLTTFLATLTSSLSFRLAASKSFPCA